MSQRRARSSVGHPFSVLLEPIPDEVGALLAGTAVGLIRVEDGGRIDGPVSLIARRDLLVSSPEGTPSATCCSAR